MIILSFFNLQKRQKRTQNGKNGADSWKSAKLIHDKLAQALDKW